MVLGQVGFDSSLEAQCLGNAASRAAGADQRAGVDGRGPGPGVGEVAGNLLGLAKSPFGHLGIDGAVPDPLDVGRGLPVPNQRENRLRAHRGRSIAIRSRGTRAPRESELGLAPGP